MVQMRNQSVSIRENVSARSVLTSSTMPAEARALQNERPPKPPDPALTTDTAAVCALMVASRGSCISTQYRQTQEHHAVLMPGRLSKTHCAGDSAGLCVSGRLTMRTLRVRAPCSGEPLLPSELLRLLPRITPLAMAARNTCMK